MGKLMLIILLLGGAFMGGYYARGLEGSPDVFGCFNEAYENASSWLGEGGDRDSDLSASAPGRSGARAERDSSGKMTVSIDGKAYVLGR